MAPTAALCLPGGLSAPSSLGMSSIGRNSEGVFRYEHLTFRYFPGSSKSLQ